ncbi:hypothetical protein Val02_59050 [Virgisporangium aliadipatigenens]|uniref:AMP-dependent synthetase/ligase domain-containing protein n=1 Tax=Virgisporangium aliadipatigenens TaxID=741659 RepID=A0A8J3YNW7_9ACTN|nr:AMP-binding protein [Virgisporangium aliadipatigenens]GIJ49019.1 hypothetical protein Val02_59050 [Virgisporangium aliadipatigenens]
MFNLATILTESARAVPDKPALISGLNRISYRDLDNRSSAVAANLAARGLVPGDAVGLQLPNTVDFAVAWFGILKAGLVAVPFGVTLRAGDIARCLDEASARAFVTGVSSLGAALDGADSAAVYDVFVSGYPVPTTPCAVGLPATPPAGPDLAAARPFADLLDPRRPVEPPVDREPEDVAALMAGDPPELTHFQLHMGTHEDIRRDDVLLGALPLFHRFGLSAVLVTAVRHGATVSLLERFSAGAALAAVQRDRVTTFAGVPSMFGALVAHPDVTRYDTSSLRSAFCGEATLPAGLVDGFEERFKVPVREEVVPLLTSRRT